MNDVNPTFWLRRMLVEHPGLFASGIYFVASLVGLIYSWAFLGAFGINVSRYAELSDFLLASLKQPFTWLLTLLAVALILMDNAMSLRVERRKPGRLFRWYGNERYRQINYLLASLMVIVFLFAYAKMNEQKIRKGKEETVSVYLTDASPAKQLVILGTTSKFVFLYDHTSERVDIHPIENILMISKPSPNPRKE